MKPHYFACPDHVDILIEEYVNNYELAPEIDLIQDTIKKTCSWCEQGAIYFILEQEPEETV